MYADTEVLGAVYTVLTSGGRVAATAGGPVVTSVVPVISLRKRQYNFSLCLEDDHSYLNRVQSSPT